MRWYLKFLPFFLFASTPSTRFAKLQGQHTKNRIEFWVHLWSMNWLELDKKYICITFVPKGLGPQQWIKGTNSFILSVTHWVHLIMTPKWIYFSNWQELFKLNILFSFEFLHGWFWKLEIICENRDILSDNIILEKVKKMLKRGQTLHSSSEVFIHFFCGFNMYFFSKVAFFVI